MICLLQDSHKPVTDSGLFEGDFEEDLLVPPKTPTTFSGAETGELALNTSSSI